MGQAVLTPKVQAPVPNQAAPPRVPKNVSRKGAKAQRKASYFLRAVAPLRENSSSKIAPPTITMGYQAERVLANHKLQKFDAKTITTSNGAPLPVAIKNPLSRSFSIDLTPIRVHTDAHAQLTVRRLHTRAFTYANHIFLGSGESPTDLRLMAHEVAHVVQQSRGAVLQHFTTTHGDALEHEAERASAAVMRGHTFNVQQRATPRPQGLFGLSLPNPLTWLANRVNSIPGFRMLTIILGRNPVNGETVPRTAANILRALVEFIPGGTLITQALDNYGIFDRVGGFVEEQINSLGMTAGAIRDAVTEFISSLSPSDILHLGGVWDRAVRIFTAPIDRIISLGRRLVTGIIGFIKDAILQPLARLASQTRGWDLLIAVLGRNPITGEAVPRTAETLIGGFMRLIGQEEVWANLQRARAVERAWAWFQGALSGLLNFVSQIPTLFVQALRSLELVDIVVLPRAFVRVGSVFANFAGQFISWAGQQVFSLLQIIFEVLAPLAMPYIRRAASALRTIFRDPVGFVRNLVRAGIQGFRQFGSNFLTHLRGSLIAWLTGAMSGANIYIPQAFNLREIIKFVLSVLGLTWQNIRTKLVRAIGETAVGALETGFQIITTLITEGPAAAWEQIREGISNLREMVMEQIMTFVRDRIVVAAITRLVTSLNPAGAFIQAVIAIYNTVMFFIERLRQIVQVAMSFIDSMAAIASGNISAAANRVEQTMAGLLTLVISFLARLVGLGRVSDAVTNVINRVRAPIDRALDRVVAWIIAQARRLGRLITGSGRAPTTPGGAAASSSVIARVRQALSARLTGPVRDEAQVSSNLRSVYAQFRPEGLRTIRVVRERGGHFNVMISASPEERGGAFDQESTLDLSDLAGGFYRKTILVARIGGRQFRRASGGGTHAEEILVPELDANWGSLGSPTELEIDINRMPCGPSQKNCAGRLADFARRRNVHLIIRAASPYPSDPTWASALRILRAEPNIDLRAWDVLATLESRYEIDPASLTPGVRNLITNRLNRLLELTERFGRLIIG